MQIAKGDEEKTVLMMYGFYGLTLNYAFWSNKCVCYLSKFLSKVLEPLLDWLAKIYVVVCYGIVPGIKTVIPDMHEIFVKHVAHFLLVHPLNAQRQKGNKILFTFHITLYHHVTSQHYSRYISNTSI